MRERDLVYLVRVPDKRFLQVVKKKPSRITIHITEGIWTEDGKRYYAIGQSVDDPAQAVTVLGVYSREIVRHLNSMAYALQNMERQPEPVEEQANSRDNDWGP